LRQSERIRVRSMHYTTSFLQIITSQEKNVIVWWLMICLSFILVCHTHFEGIVKVHEQIPTNKANEPSGIRWEEKHRQVDRSVIQCVRGASGSTWGRPLASRTAWTGPNAGLPRTHSRWMTSPHESLAPERRIHSAFIRPESLCG